MGQSNSAVVQTMMKYIESSKRKALTQKAAATNEEKLFSTCSQPLSTSQRAWSCTTSLSQMTLHQPDAANDDTRQQATPNENCFDTYEYFCCTSDPKWDPAEARTVTRLHRAKRMVKQNKARKLFCPELSEFCPEYCPLPEHVYLLEDGLILAPLYSVCTVDIVPILTSETPKGSIRLKNSQPTTCTADIVTPKVSFTEIHPKGVSRTTCVSCTDRHVDEISSPIASPEPHSLIHSLPIEFEKNDVAWSVCKGSIS